MAIQEEKRRRIARAIIKIVHECDAGMKQGVQYYRDALARGDAVEAFDMLKRAARLPYRIEARIQALISTYGAGNINTYLAVVSDQTLTTLQAELTPLKAYSDTLKDNYQNQGWTQEQIAVDIETNRADIDLDESAPIPVSYVDDF